MLTILWSGKSFSSSESPLVSIDESWKSSSNRVEIQNMPRIRDQDSQPFCAGIAVQMIVQHDYCLKKNIKDCKSVNTENEVSPISVQARCVDDYSYEEWEKIGKNPYEFYSSENHKNLTMNDESRKGCSIRQIVDRLNGSGFVMNEACYPFDQFANRFPALTKYKEYLENKSKIEQYHDKYKTEGRICMECFERDVKAFLYPTSGMKMPSAESMLEALKQSSYNKMWYYLFNQNDCGEDHEIELPSIHFKMFPGPGVNAKTVTYEKAINLIKETIVQRKKPVASSTCFNVKNDKCVGGHSFVISGFDKVCKNNECREIVKIENPWGERSYPKNSDGTLNKWYDAKSLFKFIQVTGAEFASF